MVTWDNGASLKISIILTNIFVSIQIFKIFSSFQKIKPEIFSKFKFAAFQLMLQLLQTVSKPSTIEIYGGFLKNSSYLSVLIFENLTDFYLF